MNKILIIQTAFIGDVILATSLAEKLHARYPEARLDILVRKGNESLFDGHPFINECLIWDKTKGKYSSLLAMSKVVRNHAYQLVVNCHRYASSGFITWRSKAEYRVGFDQNPMSWAFTKKVPHSLDGPHEVERYQSLIADFTEGAPARPTLYPTALQKKKIAHLSSTPYICIAPTSVWKTKEWPAHKWVELIESRTEFQVYLVGAPADKDACELIKTGAKHKKVRSLAGQLSLLESAELMRGATMNYVNDSAPLHLCTAVNAPVRSIFNSTIPLFGFTGLSDDSKVIETKVSLDCRPCGIHGSKACPLGHFNCAETIEVSDID